MAVPRWDGWGEPATRPPLPVGLARLLRDEAGARLRRREPVSLTAVPLPASRLRPDAAAALTGIVGAGQLRTDRTARAAHAGGQAYVDLVRRRSGRFDDVPDAVVSPADAAEVQAVLDACVRHSVAVVPFGGGTSVVGGVTAWRGRFEQVVSLDVGRLDRLIDVDRTSLAAALQPGLRTPAAEAALGRHGLTLGHLPQSYEGATLGGYVATRSAGQASTGYGRIDELVLGLRAATPIGELVLPARPGSAAGPDLRRLLIGSEGSFGVLTELTLRVRPIPAVRRYEGHALPDWPTGLAVLRTLAQSGAPPDVARLSDREETRVSLAAGGHALVRPYLAARGQPRPCLLICGYEGDVDDVAHRTRRAHRALRRAGALRLGQRAGASWQCSRFAGPYLRDTLLDHGVLVETVETAATWTQLPAVYQALRASLLGQLPGALAGCHLSHLYAAGASLYFTVLAAADEADPVGQWEAAKVAATDALLAAGGTLTHHHAVGTVHARWLVAEDGEVGLAALRAVKDRLDPTGILNPGKLLPS